MIAELHHEIDQHPEPEDAGTIKINARILGEDKTFTSCSFTEDFIKDENHECHSKEELNYFLMEAEIDDDVISDALLLLIGHIDAVTCPASSEYSPGCALEVWLDLRPDYLIDDADDDSQPQMEEAVQVSFDETSNVRFRPASKLVVKCLARRIYNKKIKKDNKKKQIYNKISLEECAICLEEFTNGGRLVTLPCGHDFDDDCMVKWFETSHVCPLCRFELPCEDQ